MRREAAQLLLAVREPLQQSRMEVVVTKKRSNNQEPS